MRPQKYDSDKRQFYLKLITIRPPLNYCRRRKMSILIALITIVFFLSWLPFNTLKILLDFGPGEYNHNSRRTLRVLPDGQIFDSYWDIQKKKKNAKWLYFLPNSNKH